MFSRPQPSSPVPWKPAWPSVSESGEGQGAEPCDQRQRRGDQHLARRSRSSAPLPEMLLMVAPPGEEGHQIVAAAAQVVGPGQDRIAVEAEGEVILVEVLAVEAGEAIQREGELEPVPAAPVKVSLTNESAGNSPVGPAPEQCACLAPAAARVAMAATVAASWFRRRMSVSSRCGATAAQPMQGVATTADCAWPRCCAGMPTDKGATPCP